MAYHNGIKNLIAAATAPWRVKFGVASSNSMVDSAMANNFQFTSDNAAGTAAVNTFKPLNASNQFEVSAPLGMSVVGPVTFADNATFASGKGISYAAGSSSTQTAVVTISAADLVSTSAGKFGHAAGYPLVADPGAGFCVELASAVLSYTYATAAYGDGGNITININGGAALTGLISAANSVGAAASKLVQFVPLAAAAQNLTANKGLNLVAAAAFTQPGTAAGTIKVFITYRVHAL